MTIPSWLLDIFAAIMLIVSAVSAVRLAVAGGWRGRATGLGADVDVAHLLMGIAMAGMLAAGLTTLTNAVWVVVFAVLTAWFGGRVILDARASGVRALAAGHYLPHLVHSAAMIYMFAALPAAMAGNRVGGTSGAGMSMGSGGMGTFSAPTVGLVFAILLAGYAVWDLDQLAPAGRRPRARTGLGFTPAPAAAVVLEGLGHRTTAITDVPAPVASSGEGTAAGAVGPASAGTPGSVGTPAVPIAGLAEVRALVLNPSVAVGCRIAMSITMAFMLIIMI